jgi:pentalenic acid synthase
MRERGAVVRAELPNGVGVWAVTRHAEAREVLSDPRVSSATGRPERPRGADDDRPDEGFFVDLDPPEHGRYRRVLIPELGARAVAGMRERIGEIVGAAVDGMVAGGTPGDVVARFARPVAVRVVCELLGVPERDWGFFESRLGRLTVMRQDPRVVEASREVREYLREMIGRAAREPVGGLVGRIVRRDVVSVDALVNMAFLVLLAGYESPANMISLGVVTLLEHPEQLAAVRAEPGLLPGAVDELLRFHSVQDWVSFDRTAVADLDVGGVRVRAGDRLTVLAASANRDERAFDDPDAFDIRRTAHHHLAFGYGAHQCIGHNLARAELEIAYGTLLARLPALRLAVPFGELPFATDSGLYGLHALPVAW